MDDQFNGQQQQPYSQPQQQYAPPQGQPPYQQQPYYGQQKSRLTAGLLGIFLGGLGIHRFYLGYPLIGILQIICSFAFGAGYLWGLIEGILILCKVDYFNHDANGVPLKD